MANCVFRYPLYFETLINKIKLNLHIHFVPFSTQKSEVWSESACGSSVVSSARASVPPPIPSIGVFPNIPTTLSCSAVSCSGGHPPPVFLASRRLRDAVFFILLD